MTPYRNGCSAMPVDPSVVAVNVPEVAWFAALCDDDYEFLGVPDPALVSSWEHCRDIVQCADRRGYDNVLVRGGRRHAHVAHRSATGGPRR